MQPLATRIVEKTRDYVLEMIATVYKSIQLAQASTLFGLPEQELVEVLVGRGWTLNEGILHPVKPGKEDRRWDIYFDNNTMLVACTRLGGDDQFERLADVVFNLEKF
jgi:hypothetical protein